MKPTMNLVMRMSTYSSQSPRYTEQEILDEFFSGNIEISPKCLVIRKTDGAVMGEILGSKK